MSSAFFKKMQMKSIIRTPDCCGGSARIDGTRITVLLLVGWKIYGWSDDQIIDQYPHLTKEDLTAAWDYYESHKQEIDQEINDEIF